ncbi:MAG: HPr family phosphocarrier protein [Nitrososphaeria archaeon]
MTGGAVSFKAKLNNRLGLHARPASLLVETTKRFRSRILVKKGEKVVDGKSIVSVLTLGAEYGDEIEITCEGEDAEEAAEALKELIERLPELEAE